MFVIFNEYIGLEFKKKKVTFFICKDGIRDSKRLSITLHCSDVMMIAHPNEYSYVLKLDGKFLVVEAESHSFKISEVNKSNEVELESFDGKMITYFVDQFGVIDCRDETD